VLYPICDAVEEGNLFDEDHMTGLMWTGRHEKYPMQFQVHKLMASVAHCPILLVNQSQRPLHYININLEDPDC
jgi:hypothetical protein